MKSAENIQRDNRFKININSVGQLNQESFDTLKTSLNEKLLYFLSDPKTIGNKIRRFVILITDENSKRLRACKEISIDGTFYVRCLFGYYFSFRAYLNHLEKMDRFGLSLDGLRLIPDSTIALLLKS